MEVSLISMLKFIEIRYILVVSHDGLNTTVSERALKLFLIPKLIPDHHLSVLKRLYSFLVLNIGDCS